MGPGSSPGRRRVCFVVRDSRYGKDVDFKSKPERADVRAAFPQDNLGDSLGRFMREVPAVSWAPR